MRGNHINRLRKIPNFSPNCFANCRYRLNKIFNRIRMKNFIIISLGRSPLVLLLFAGAPLVALPEHIVILEFGHAGGVGTIDRIVGAVGEDAAGGEVPVGRHHNVSV